MSEQVNQRPYFQFVGAQRWVLYLPFLSLVAVLFEIVFHISTGQKLFSQLDQKLNLFVINVLLLNSLHLIFPFMVLFFLPKGREYAQSKFHLWTKQWWMGLMASLVVGVLFLISLNSTKNLELLGTLGPPLAGSMVWVWYLVPTFHGIRQSAGVSFLMTTPQMQDSSKVTRARLLERNLFRAYHVGVIWTFLVQKWWGQNYPVVVWISSFITLAVAGAIIFNTKRTCAHDDNDKFLFSFRYLLWPLQPYSQIVVWSVVFNHGIEYVALLMQMLRASSSQRRFQTMFIAITVLGMTMISFYNFFEYAYQKYPDWAIESWAFSILLSFYPFLTLLHYAVDGLIYRMSDPVVRGSVGQLFMSQFLSPRSK